MRIPRFEYLEPRTLSEASTMLAEHRDKARVIAGGTDLLVQMKHRVVRPEYLVNIKRIPELSDVRFSVREGLHIGPLVTLNKLAEHPDVVGHFPALAQAAGKVAAPNIRNTATIGGNLGLDAKCWYYNQSPLFYQGRDPCFKRGGDRCYVVTGGKFCYGLVASDTVAALVALGAEVTVANASQKRTFAVTEMFTGRGSPVNVLGPGDIIVGIRVPAPAPHTSSVFLKEAFRASIDFGIANVAVSLTMDDGVCREAKIALTGVTCKPVDARQAAAKLQGKRLSDEVVAEAAQEATREVSPISSIWTSVFHRRHVIPTLVKRATLQAAGQAQQGRR